MSTTTNTATPTATSTPAASTAPVTAPAGPVNNPRLRSALALAARGWPVFPLYPGGKNPVWHSDDRDRPCPRTGPCASGHRTPEQMSTTRPDLITRCWTAHPAHNVAVLPGPADLIVIDLDVAKPGKALPEDCIRVGAVHGAQMLARLARQHGETVPDTFTVKTPSGGTHLYFRVPAGPGAPRLGNTHNRLAGLIDTRARGGYAVAPGSATREGVYELIDDRDPAPLPGWLLRLLTAPPPAPPAPPRQLATGGLSPYVEAAIAGETERVATAPEGGHNHAQRSAGAALGELVGTKGPDGAPLLDYHTAFAALMQSAAGHVTGRCKCTERGIAAVFHSALRYGMDHPRQISIDDTTNDRHGGRVA